MTSVLKYDVSENNVNHLTFFSTKSILPRFEYKVPTYISLSESAVGTGANDEGFN